MIKLCVLIGEGLSERYFLPSLIQHKLNFQPLSEKSPHLFQKNDQLFWFFPFPPETTNPEGGKGRLQKTETYRTANVVIENKSYLFNEPPRVHYRIIVDHIFTDTEGQKRKKREIEEAIKKSGVPYASCKVEIVENEIECWYFAGLSESFPHINRSEMTLLREFLNLEPERISEPKAKIRKILSPDAQGTIKMADVLGQHFDIEQARAKSKSFDTFMANLEGEGLV